MLNLPTAKLKALFSPLTLALSLAIATPAMAKYEHDHQKNQLRHVLAKLELSHAQRQDVKQILRQSRADAGLLSADVKEAKTELQSLIHADSWDQAAVETALQLNQQTMATLGLEKATSMHQIWSLLNDQQKAQFAQLAEDRKANKGDRKFKHANKDESAHNRDGQFAGLNLSAEQKAAIKSIRQQTKTQHQAAKEQQIAFRQAERALIASPDFNDTAYQALQAEYQDEHLQQALLMAKTRHDIWNVLTAEQQAQALAKMAERKART